MPKSKWGSNPKAEAARERQQEAKHSTAEKKRQEEEDEYWKDDDKHVARKEERKADRDKKRQEQLEKKQLKKKLLEEEEEKVGGKARGTMAPPPKVTRAQAEEAKEKREQLELAAAASRVPAKVVETPREEEGELEENPNQLLKQSAMEGEAVARGVDSAIAVLGGGEPTELHPEKRMKAAYAAFEERELPKLKEENPNLRLSQLKQLLRKEWQKSPDNPMNQALAGRSTST